MILTRNDISRHLDMFVDDLIENLMMPLTKDLIREMLIESYCMERKEPFTV